MNLPYFFFFVGDIYYSFIKWVNPCKETVREIWVPSHFNVETFSKSGVNQEKLVVVPEPIDIFTYNSDNTGFVRPTFS